MPTQINTSGQRILLPSLSFCRFMAIWFFMLAVGSFAFAAPELKTSEADITRLQTIYKKIGHLESEAKRIELEKLFRARSAAHRLRLSQIFLKISQDKNFLKEFPEFEPLVKNAKKTVTALLEHDASKADAATAKAIRILSMSQGLNYRNPPPGLSAEDKELIVRTMKNAIDDLNTIDDEAMANVLKKVSPNNAWKKAHDALTETIDFYDTYMARQAELAKDGKPLISPSEWIEQLEREGFYSEEEKKENVLKKRFAKYLEKANPLSDATSFAKAEDFAKLANSLHFTEDLEKAFSSKGRGLVLKAVVMDTMHTLSRLGSRFATGAPLSYSLLAGAEYVMAPETANLTDTLAHFTMSTDTANCDSTGCLEFVKTCAALLKTNATSFNQLSTRDDFSKCVHQFFNLPLKVQTQRRRDDDNLDRLLDRFAPRLETLTCAPDGKSVQTQIDGEDKTSIPTNLIFSSSGANLSQIAAIDPEQKKQNRLFFSNAGAQSFQNCTTSTSCKNYEIKDLLNIKLGIWRSDKLPRPANGPLQQVDIDSFKWARKAY